MRILEESLRIPSVSTDPARRDDMARCAAFIRDTLEEEGLSAEVIPTDGHPAVYGERAGPPGAPTLLVYGHYDVQPPDPIEAWNSPPFEPAIIGEDIFARGASDDKGQLLALVLGIGAYIAAEGSLPIHVKCLIEGEEEVGSSHLEPLLKGNPDRFRPDAIMIADSSQFAPGVPAITYGLRGLVYLEITLRGPKQDLHSGSFGGAVANPANVLAGILNAMRETGGRIAIPGFYEGVRPLAEWEQEEFRNLPFDEEGFRLELGVPRLCGEDGYTTLERRWARPSFDVNGITAGYQGEGTKTVIPAWASAKLSFRIVPDQDPDAVADLAEGFVRELVPDSVTVEVKRHNASPPLLLETTGPAFAAAKSALKRVFGRDPVLIREGGSIPITTTLRDLFPVPMLLTGIGLPDDNAHAPNEKLHIPDFHRGILAMACFIEEYARAARPAS